jgi:hypothetical protein
MHTLQEFLLKNVVPAVEQLRQAQQHKNLPTTRGAYASVLESFLWLHLGTEIGVFPPEASRAIASTYYGDFFQSLNRPRDEMLEKVEFASKLYVGDTPESRELKATFPDFIILIEQAMRGQNAFDAQRNEFRDPVSLKPAFKNFLRLALVLASDPLVQRFTSISQFTDAAEWEAEWRGGDCNSEEVELAGENAELAARPTPAIIFAGFLRLWSYSYQLREMSSMYEGEEIRGDDRFKLLDRVKNILRWRINLRSRELANRFESVRSELKKQLDNQAAETGSLQPSVDFIKDSFDSVFEFWSVYETVGAR